LVTHSRLLDSSNSSSKHPILLLQIPQRRPDIRHRERESRHRLHTRTEVDSMNLEAEAAAVGVVRHLRCGVLDDAFPVIVDGFEPRAQSTMVEIAKAAADAELIRGR